MSIIANEVPSGSTPTVGPAASLRANYTIPVEWGTVTPGVLLEYRHAFEGGFTRRLGYAVIGTPAVRVAFRGRRGRASPARSWTGAGRVDPNRDAT